jgi:Cys-tRNA synthase (O-phospho-L-seryl-tRNA:Cys-tRNA synthase)
MSHEVGHYGDGYVVCDVCGRGPSSKVWIMPRYWRAKRQQASERERRDKLAWARAAGRRIGLEIKAEIAARDTSWVRGPDCHLKKETASKRGGMPFGGQSL